jgi:hypothetical protein
MRLCCMASVIVAISTTSGWLRAAEERPLYTQKQIVDLSKRFHIYDNGFYLPRESFLGTGYAPPGGYVKDFSVIKHQGRYHLFHIDGRPQERCVESGNEISFGHASSADLRHWVRHRMPLAVGDRPWENEHVWAPFVTEWNGRFYMFYMASGRETDGAISYAVSDNLETWTKWPAGPIKTAAGRDPFVRIANGTVHLYYTANRGGIELVRSRDMQHWSAAETVMSNKDRLPAESSSVHRRGRQWLLWYNDYLHCNDPSGDFRAVYISSQNPFSFDPRQLKVFKFTTSLPTKYGGNDWLEKRPIPVSIELLERGDKVWLVAYFRWHIDRFRLFIGALRWDEDPAEIEEIVAPARLKAVLAEVQSKP